MNANKFRRRLINLSSDWRDVAWLTTPLRAYSPMWEARIRQAQTSSDWRIERVKWGEDKDGETTDG